MKPYALFPRTPGLFSSLNVQKNMLQDNIRNRAFKEAIFRNVKRDDVVIDLGTGTGILAIWAAQAGARKVYAIEETDVADVAEAVIRDNGFQDVITVLKANSSEVMLPEKADVLIAELVGHFLFEEGIVEAISEVRQALMKPDLTIVPSGARVFLAPVELGNGFSEVSYWTRWCNPDLSAVADYASNSAYVETVPQASLMAAPLEFFEVDFMNAIPGALLSQRTFELRRSGRVDALAGWFHLFLDETSSIDSGPMASPTHWQQCIFPLRNALAVEMGERLRCQFRLNPCRPGCRWQWSVSGGARDAIAENHDMYISYGQDSRLIKERF